MIYLAWIINISLALIVAILLRRLFSNILLKRFIYAFFLSLFLTVWFSYPGGENIAPILSIYLIDLLESGELIKMRLIRPFILVFFLILLFDFLFFRYRSKKK